MKRRTENPLSHKNDFLVGHDGGILIGSAREVVSRLLKYMSREGIVSLSRGKITITDRQKAKTAAGL